MINLISLFSFPDYSIESILFSLVIGVLSSFIFIFLLLYLMRPRIKISPNICYLRMEPDNEYYYVFKIVNKSLFYAFDINIKLVKKEPYMVNKGQKINRRIKEINTSSKHLNHLPRSRKKIGYGDHAYLIRTKHDIRSDIENKDVSVKLSVGSKHGLSNLARVVTQDFLYVDVIKIDKEFRFGTSLDVV